MSSDMSLITKVYYQSAMKSIKCIFILLLIILSCSEQKDFDYALIQTGEVTGIDSTGAVFHASITSSGKADIFEYGFVWDLEKIPDLNSSKILLEGPVGNGIINIKISSDLLPDTYYYVRAFAKNGSYTTYGRVVKFRSAGSLVPEILDFSPTMGAGGTVVTIIGKNFSSSITGNVVKFGRETAIITEASSDKLVVTLPYNLALAGTVNIVIETSNRVVVSASRFNLLGSNILTYKPTTLKGGDIIYVMVENFIPEMSDNSLKIGGKEAEIIKLNNDTIIAYVPYDAAIGPNELSLFSNGRTCYADDKVIIKDPWKAIAGSTSFLRRGPIGFSIGSHGYVGLGYYENGSPFYDPYKDLWEFNPENSSWKQCADLPDTGREDAVSFSIGGKGYTCLGNYGGSIFFTDLYMFDPVDNSWSKKANFPGEQRIRSICLVIGDKAYMGLGAGIGVPVIRDFWEYDPGTDMWTRLADYPGGGPVMASGFAINDKGYVGLGMGDYGSLSRDFWEYDPASNTWSQISDFPGLQRSRSVGFSIGKYGYIGTGLNWSGDPLNDFWRYDMKAAKWIRMADIPSGSRYDSQSFVIDSKGYISSGIFTGQDLIEFNPN